MNLIDDSDPGTFRENFSKQRRNLILMTSFLYIYLFVGITEIKSEQSLFGLNFKLSNPEYIPIILSIIFIYFLLRYYQAWFLLGKQDPGGYKYKVYLETIRKHINSDKESISEVKKYIHKDTIVEKIYLIEDGMVGKNEIGVVFNVNANIVVLNEDGKEEEFRENGIKVTVANSVDNKAKRTAFLTSCLKTNLFTEYYLPPTLAILLIAMSLFY